MKRFFKIFLKSYLKFWAKTVILLHRPHIIAIAGNTNKTFVKEEIKKTLKRKGFSVRANPKSFNTEIGLPLAILGLSSGYNSYIKWLKPLAQAPRLIFKSGFPKVLVLELGTSRKGDAKYLLSIIRPKITVITDITQRYLQSFLDMDSLTKEFELLIKATKDLAVLNIDNERIKSISRAKKIKIITVGIDKKADYQAISVKRGNKGEIIKILGKKNRVRKYNLLRFGRHHVYKKLIALAIEESIKGKI